MSRPPYVMTSCVDSVQTAFIRKRLFGSTPIGYIGKGSRGSKSSRGHSRGSWRFRLVLIGNSYSTTPIPPSHSKVMQKCVSTFSGTTNTKSKLQASWGHDSREGDGPHSYLPHCSWPLRIKAQRQPHRRPVQVWAEIEFSMILLLTIFWKRSLLLVQD